VQSGGIEGSDAEVVIKLGKRESRAAGAIQQPAVKYNTGDESWCWEYTDSARSAWTVTARR